MSVGLYAAVAAGGAIGAMLRYTVSLFLGAGLFGFTGPLATVTVNVVGSGLMGLLAGGFALPEPVRAFVVIGLLGALTTFPALRWTQAPCYKNRVC
jgi:CrcB protein